MYGMFSLGRLHGRVADLRPRVRLIVPVEQAEDDHQHQVVQGQHRVVQAVLHLLVLEDAVHRAVHVEGGREAKEDEDGYVAAADPGKDAHEAQHHGQEVEGEEDEVEDEGGVDDLLDRLHRDHHVDDPAGEGVQQNEARQESIGEGNKTVKFAWWTWIVYVQ
jgi:hypothetical protein